jgi:adenine-specific DNA-methyltransferase
MRAVGREHDHRQRRELIKNLEEIESDLQSARIEARAWSVTVAERQRQQSAWAFIRTAMDAYLAAFPSAAPVVVTPPTIAWGGNLAKPVAGLARVIGREAAELPIEEACYQLCATYAALVPKELRSARGMYYTPPALANRLLDMVEQVGVDWGTARVLDPACGGGAFLLPVALRIRKALADRPPQDQLMSIARRLRGFEIDPFAAWLAQAWLEIALYDLPDARGHLSDIVRVCDTLDQEPDAKLFDLVIGNPPYGRVSLTPQQRRRFARSLYGHANLYGVFTDIAMRWTKPAGVVAYVTPTSFLAGEYFKMLRLLLAREAPPSAIDFINARRGVFEDVLQEALLATYHKGGTIERAIVHHLTFNSNRSARNGHAGHFVMPVDPAAPWLAPRSPNHQILVDCLNRMPHRLADWGYRVSTGPLVWNRHKDQLRTFLGKNVFPIVWAECVTADGRFVFRADKRNHEPYFRIEKGDEWLKVNAPCVLVQRTTAKEQHRRLIAAEMPRSFVRRHGAVIVENHLNMIRGANGQAPKVSTAALAALLNSSIADEAFRCISGSVAVSAFELEAMPLPSPEKMQAVEALLRSGAQASIVDRFIRQLYLSET